MNNIVGPSQALARSGLRTLAFYLPQFHPIPENDRWWGAGFTEWTNVTRAKPMFAGHYQPHLPGAMGFYDLRLPEVYEAQAALALRHGIAGFCFYYYWFAGKRLLERPLETMRERGTPDFPYCLCWANENWTRRWDGAEQEILIAQEPSAADDARFIRDLMPHLTDRRYLRVEGKPLLIVYRIGILEDPARTAAIWRDLCRRAGVGDIYLCAAKTYETADPTAFGFDAVVEFPPHGINSARVNERIEPYAPGYESIVIDYPQFVLDWLTREPEAYPVHPTVMPGWDNSARRPANGMVFIDSSPEYYALWLEEAAARVIATQQSGRRLVFVNAWNEWAEGTHLEPDRRYGDQVLRATRLALERAASRPPGALSSIERALAVVRP